MRDILTVRTPKTLGCTLVSTALVQSLRETFKNRRIDIYTGFPDLLIGLKEADRIIDLENEALPKYDIDLYAEKYVRRVSIAMTQHCYAGITLDTFLLHGSEAVGAKNVIALLTSSHHEVVAYPDQTVIDQSRTGAPITASIVLDKLASFG